MADSTRPRRPSFSSQPAPSEQSALEQLALAEQRIARLEGQVDALRRAVRELADALHEELTAAETRISNIEGNVEELAKSMSSTNKAVKRQEERLKRGLTVIADALSALTITSSPSDT